MKKIIALFLSIFYVFSGVFVMPAKAEDKASGTAEYKWYQIEWDSKREPIVAYENIKMTILYKVTLSDSDYELDESSSKVYLDTASDFFPRQNREIYLEADVRNNGSNNVEIYFDNLVYRGSGSSFEIYGNLVYTHKSDATADDIVIPIAKVIAVVETGTIGEAPAPALQPYIVKYEVSSPKIAKGDVFSIAMEVVDPNYRYADLVGKNFDSSIALLSDKNFNASNMQGIISNIGADGMGNLKYQVRFDNIVYQGPDNVLEFRVNYRTQVIIDGKVYKTTSDKTLSRTIFEASGVSAGDSNYMPNVLITNYTGSGGVVAGQRLDFKVTFKNMSDTTTVTDVVIAVDGGNAFAMAKGVNKIFISSIAPQEEVTIDLSMLANKSAEPSSYPIKFDVRYNYAGKTDGTMSSEIAIPIKQIDRVRINYVKIQNAWVNSEVEVNYSIVNSGLTMVKNAQIEVLDEDNNSLATLFLGNIEPGKEAKGTNMYVMFSEGREYQLTLRLTYEDDNFNAKELLEPFTVFVQGEDIYIPPIIDPQPFPTEEPSGKNKNWLFFGGAAIIAAGVVGFVLYKRRKNKQGVIDDADL